MGLSARPGSERSVCKEVRQEASQPLSGLHDALTHLFCAMLHYFFSGLALTPSNVIFTGLM